MESKVEGLEENCPKFVEKALILKQTLGHFNKLDMTDTFDQKFNQFAHSTATFPIFKVSLSA